MSQKMNVVPWGRTALVNLNDAIEFAGGSSMRTPTWWIFVNGGGKSKLGKVFGKKLCKRNTLPPKLCGNCNTLKKI
jgi:hypothetical protein